MRGGGKLIMCVGSAMDGDNTISLYFSVIDGDKKLKETKLFPANCEANCTT
jgi:hypothetical protein